MVWEQFSPPSLYHPYRDEQKPRVSGSQAVREGFLEEVRSEMESEGQKRDGWAKSMDKSLGARRVE